LSVLLIRAKNASSSAAFLSGFFYEGREAVKIFGRQIRTGDTEKRCDCLLRGTIEEGLD
jgi:hypothetical protein